jgi:hypothetical protein
MRNQNIVLPFGFIARVIKETGHSRRTVERSFAKKENISIGDLEIKKFALQKAQELNIPEDIYNCWFNF